MSGEGATSPHHDDGMSQSSQCDCDMGSLIAARRGEGFAGVAKGAGVRSFGRRANFFEKTGAQWKSLAAFSTGRPSLLQPQHGWRLLLPPSDKGKGSILSHSSQTQVWAIAC